MCCVEYVGNDSVECDNKFDCNLYVECEIKSERMNGVKFGVAVTNVFPVRLRRRMSRKKRWIQG